MRKWDKNDGSHVDSSAFSAPFPRVTQVTGPPRVSTVQNTAGTGKSTSRIYTSCNTPVFHCFFFDCFYIQCTFWRLGLYLSATGEGDYKRGRGTPLWETICFHRVLQFSGQRYYQTWQNKYSRGSINVFVNFHRKVCKGVCSVGVTNNHFSSVVVGQQSSAADYKRDIISILFLEMLGH